MNHAAITLALFLSGCTSVLPPPTTEVPAGNCQLRLTEIDVSTGVAGVVRGEVEGCAYTQLGDCPHVASLTSETARCKVEMRPAP